MFSVFIPNRNHRHEIIFISFSAAVLQRQMSTGTLHHSINSEERQALEVFDQIYEEHISDEEPKSHQVASGRKSAEAHVRKHISLGKHRRHEYENTMYSVLGPGFQQGTTSFAQSDSGEQSDAQSIGGPFKEIDGSFYFMGGSENVRITERHRTLSERKNNHDSVKDRDRNVHGAILDKHESNGSSIHSLLRQETGRKEMGPMRDDDAKINENQEDNRVTTITEQNDNGSVTSYTIRSNVTIDNQLYHSTVIISQNSEIPPPLPPFSRHPSYNSVSSKATSTIPRTFDNDTEKWNTLYSNTTSHRSHISHIDDYLDDCDSVEQEVALTNQNHHSVPEYAHVQKVDMKIHRIQNEDSNKTPSWLHKEFVNTAYVSD